MTVTNERGLPLLDRWGRPIPLTAHAAEDEAKARPHRAAAGYAGMTVEPLGRPDLAVMVAEADVRRAFAGTAIKDGLAAFTWAVMVDLRKEADRLGLTLGGALWALPTVSLYAVRVGGKTWVPSVQQEKAERDVADAIEEARAAWSRRRPVPPESVAAIDESDEDVALAREVRAFWNGRNRK